MHLVGTDGWVSMPSAAPADPPFFPDALAPNPFNTYAFGFRDATGLDAQGVAALRGHGIVMQTEILLAEDVAAGRLVSLLNNYLPPPRPMHLVYPRDRQATPKLKTFVEFMLERFGA